MTMVAGIDVGKANLDVSVSGGPVLRFDNTATGITKLRKHLQEHDTTLAVCEPTGGYETAADQPVARDRYCGARGPPGPGARFRQSLRLRGQDRPTGRPGTLPLRGGVFRRRIRGNRRPTRSVKSCATCSGGGGNLLTSGSRSWVGWTRAFSATIAKSTRRHIAWLEKEIARLEKEYQAVLQDNATLADRAALYRTVPGIGPLTAATLVAHLPELGHWDSKALTSLVGLAPWSRDSGKKRGHRAIRGGRGLVRRALYMCAWAVIRHDSEMRRFYDRLRQRGKPGNVAVVAVMRKILLQLNAVARRGTPWVPQDA